jgi:stage V sporulation protein B
VRARPRSGRRDKPPTRENRRRESKNIPPRRAQAAVSGGKGGKILAYSRKGVVHGALILTAASVATRLLGFFYRIYMSNAIGAEGMGLYQLILPVYSLTWAISCAGFTTTVSKVVSAENAKKEYGNMGRALKQSLVITGLAGLLISAGLYFVAGFIGACVLKDGRAVLPLKVLSLAVPFMAASSCVRGYFLGLHESGVPAVSQVLEQCVRMAVIFTLAPMMARGLSYAAAAAVFGIVFGEGVSFLYVMISYRAFKRKHRLISKPSTPAPAMLASIFSMALPLTANRVTGSLLSMAENTLIPQRLQLSGMTRSAAFSAYGRVTGMAMPLIFFPSALLVSVSIALVPTISEAIATGDKRRVSETISKTALFTGVMAMGTCALFVTFPGELGRAIYRQDIKEPLLLLGLMCPLWYLGITFGGILNGLGQQGFMFRSGLLSSAVTITCVYFFVPVYGVNAFLGGWFISLVITTALNLLKVYSVAGVRAKTGRWFIRPGAAALAAGLVSRLAYERLLGAAGFITALTLSIALLCFIYASAVFALKCVSPADFARILPARKEAAHEPAV